MSSDAETALLAWLRTHHGVISRSEALRLGLTVAQVRSRVESGLWVPLHRGVYRLAGAPAGAAADLRAAVLAGGPRALASHLSAAWLWGLADRPGRPTVSIPHSRVRSVDGVRILRSRLPARAVVRHGIPCTEPVRTILDCAGELTPAEIDDLMDAALARRVVRTRDLVKAVEQEDAPFRGHPGRVALSTRLAMRGVTGAPAPSVLESRMARVLATERLPAPTAELVWGPQRRYRLDYAYPVIKLAVEVDGHAFHFTPEQQRRDNRRSNALTTAGWIVLHYNWWDVSYEPQRVASEIAAAYMNLSAKHAHDAAKHAHDSAKHAHGNRLTEGISEASPPAGPTAAGSLRRPGTRLPVPGSRAVVPARPYGSPAGHTPTSRSRNAKAAGG